MTSFATISTAVGQYRIEPFGLNHFDVYDEAGRSLVMLKKARGWWLGVVDLRIDRRSANVLITAVERWMAANRKGFYEMARRSLKGESGRARTEELGTWVSVLRQIVKILRVTGGTIDGHNLRHYERLLKMTAAVDSLQHAAA